MNHTLPLPPIHTNQLNRMNSPRLDSITPPMNADALLGMGGRASSPNSLNTNGAFMNHKNTNMPSMNGAPASQLMGLNDLKAFQQLFQQQADPTANSVLQNFLQKQGQMQQTAQLGLMGSAGMFAGNVNTIGNSLATDADNLKTTSFLLQKQLMMNRNPLNAATTRLLNGNPGMNQAITFPNATPNELPLPSPNSLFGRDSNQRKRGGVIEPFPEKLHRLLLEVEAAGRSDVISFVAGGRAFAIHKPEVFFKEIVPYYFRQSRLSSFKRQLNLYGFELITTGPARGGYYHESFVRDKPEQCRKMRRVMASKQQSKASSSSEKNNDGNASANSE